MSMRRTPLEVLDLSDLTEASSVEGEVEHVATSTEAILLSLEDATSFEVLVLLFATEMDM